jgi:hypothetical protein
MTGSGVVVCMVWLERKKDLFSYSPLQFAGRNCSIVVEAVARG